MAIQINDVAALEIRPIVLKLHPVIKITDDQYYEFCQLN